MNKITFKIIILFLFSGFISNTFSQNGDIDKNIISKINNFEKDLNIGYPHFILTIPNYSLLGINCDNYIEYGQTEIGDIFPFVDNNYDYDIHIMDCNRYYFVPTKDTLTLEQDITVESIFEKTIRIIPLEDSPKVRYKIYIALLETIEQQYIQGIENRDDVYELDFLETWKGFTPFKKLKNNNQWLFKIPRDKDLNNLNALKRQLSLQDTYVYYEGEISKEATVIYKGRPSTFSIDGALLKIERHDENGAITTYYIHININYGC